jgi:hypothetical protein
MTYCYEQGLGKRSVYDKLVTVLQPFKRHDWTGLMEQGDWPTYVETPGCLTEPVFILAHSASACIGEPMMGN